MSTPTVRNLARQ
uniref:Uncharacterized protein n=1 Tax=Arundo donax TaxID=35708 RepID=A0A0A9EKF4_ARUDO